MQWWTPEKIGREPEQLVHTVGCFVQVTHRSIEPTQKGVGNLTRTGQQLTQKLTVVTVLFAPRRAGILSSILLIQHCVRFENFFLLNIN